MDLAKLIAEGERLARPWLLLSDDSKAGDYAAIWGGPGVLKPEPGPWKHWISVDCAWLAKQGISVTGLVSIYSNEDDCQTGIVVHDSAARLPERPKNRKPARENRKWAGRPDKSGEVALFGSEHSSFPPLDAVFKYGGAAVKKWLRSLGLPKWKNWDPFFQARQEAEPYNDEWRKRYPAFDRSLGHAAALGGWHASWDSDWFELCDHHLILSTFWNSEPWIEVWLSKDGSFDVKQRIT